MTEAALRHKNHKPRLESMKFRPAAIFPPALRATALLIALLHAPAPGHAQQGPFAALAGAWSGGGYIKLTNGQRERLRCRATYNVGENGTRLQQNLRCASDSYRFDVNSNVVSDGGALTGNWSEINRNVFGNLSGRVNGSQIQARIDGAGFSANSVINTRGDRQSVTIQSPGHEITEVSATLSKSK
jgi:hypothetical protein